MNIYKLNVQSNQPKKIALVRSSYSPYGGAEGLTLDILFYLLEMDKKICLLTWPNQKWPLNHPNLQIITLGHYRGHRLWRLWSFEHFVKKYLASNFFECVFSLDLVSQYTHVHAGGGSHKTFLKVKNESSSYFERIYHKFSLFHMYTIHLQKKGFSNPIVKKIHCCSQMVADDINTDYQVSRDKIQIIYNGINWERIGVTYRQRAETGNKIFEKHKLNSEHNWLLFLGSGFTRKGLDIAIKGLYFLPESYHLMVVGSGNYRLFLKQAPKLGVGKRVHFIGPQKEGWRFAAACKALILPSRYEPFGLAAAKAHAMGLPVLVSDRTGYSELVLEGENGVILKRPMREDHIQHAFDQIQQLIKYPQMTATEIRDRVEELDNQNILRTLINEFLEL